MCSIRFAIGVGALTCALLLQGCATTTFPAYEEVIFLCNVAAVAKGNWMEIDPCAVTVLGLEIVDGVVTRVMHGAPERADER